MNTLQKVVLGMLILGTTFFFFSCQSASETETAKIKSQPLAANPALMVLGIAQDAGYPQINCQKDCCSKVWNQKQDPQMVSCIGLLDRTAQKYWLIDATPDIKSQLQLLKEKMPEGQLAGVFLTHAHMGHYTGLMELGREAWGAQKIPVFVMSRMKKYLENNGPWDQLVALENIQLQELSSDSIVSISAYISVTPFLVPHRDEYSETVGYQINGPNRSSIFIPDIDKWEKWDRNIDELIGENEYAFLDGTFFRANELPGRNMAEIPHPFIEESLDRFKTLSVTDQKKIHFIHLNHTNPLLWNQYEKSQIENSNFNLAKVSSLFYL